MESMFSKASSFNQPIGSWNMKSTENLSAMFATNACFNQPLNSWNVCNVNNMNGLFFRATAFNQPLDQWDVSNVETMGSIFFEASSFRQFQSLLTWNIDKVVEVDCMFFGLPSFDRSLLTTWSSFVRRDLADKIAMFEDPL